MAIFSLLGSSIIGRCNMGSCVRVCILLVSVIFVLSSISNMGYIFMFCCSIVGSYVSVCGVG